jgi:pimeloyl-ACP methyl ester carboxylesterase
MRVYSVLFALVLLPLFAQEPALPPSPPPPILITAAQRAELQSKVDQLDAGVQQLKAHRGEEALVADVEVYEKAGKWLLEFPEDCSNEQDFTYTLAVLDRGLERARQLQSGQSPWVAQPGRKIHGMYSALDGSVQPYGVNVPASYDGSKPVRLYVWLHGRAARLSEGNFIYTYTDVPPAPTSTMISADVGQIQLDVYGRWNNGYKWAGEVDVAEAIAAVERRYNIDSSRIVLRGFSLGGEGAWHLALHEPDRWAAAEIGAGTWPRRYLSADLYPPYQRAVLKIWENMTEWALNGFDLPIAAHDGDSDTQVSSVPHPPPGTPSRGQLESSLRVREQLAKEGFPSVGTQNDMAAEGTPDMFLISEKTGHGVSPLVRQQLDAFLKKWGDRGQVSPDHIRFLTYTTRYNKCYWISLDGLAKHYERADVDAVRNGGGEQYRIITHNVTRLRLRETGHAAEIRIDGQKLRLKPAPEIALEKFGSAWRQARSVEYRGRHKTHALQGPIDDAFLDPFLLVRPTGTPWNDAVNQQSLRTLARFDKLYARHLRAHPRVKDDKAVTAADFAEYNLVLFGDPGSNRWIARIKRQLPVRWTREVLTVGSRTFPARQYFPMLVYPNPLNPRHYVVLNTGLTIDEREYRADYSLPRIGDFAVLQVQPGADVPSVALAGLFDESWRLPDQLGPE